LLKVLGTSALPAEDFSELTSLVNEMIGIYNRATVCPFDDQNCGDDGGLSLEPDLEEIMSSPGEHSFDELQYVWEEWRAVSGALMRDQFLRYVELNNKAAVANGFNDASELWLVPYSRDYGFDDDRVRDDVDEIWQTIRPLYVKLHGYIRYKYREYWGEDLVEEDAAIPAFLTGNMWGQAWQNTFNLVAPYPDVPSQLEEVNEALIEQGYSVEDIFELSNSFYDNLGLMDMEVCYDTDCDQADTDANKECHYDSPMIVKPEWDVTCHASAWDFYAPDKNDYRVKMCTTVSLENLVTIHHEMGHIQYFQQYAGQNLQYRDGANPGFHEAIGDTMALALQTPRHLFDIGLLSSVDSSEEADINFLLQQAMERVMFMPFGLMIDKYRWEIFQGNVDEGNLNERWWQLREDYQGLAPPSTRGEEFFDAGAKYHVASDVPYIRYFIAHILEYSFYKTMCLESENYDPLDPARPLFKCDFSAGSLGLAAGGIMSELLQAGASQPWPDTLRDFTGSSVVDASAVLEYFAPLDEWLDEQINEIGFPVGW